MKKGLQKKIDAILYWYSIEAPKFDIENKIKLLDNWISVFLEEEDYEIANALQKEKDKLVK